MTSHHDKGQMFGTDGVITWYEQDLFAMLDELEELVIDITKADDDGSATK